MCTAWGIRPIFHNYKWSIIYKILNSLCATSESNISSIQFSLSRLQLFATHWPQHTRPPCPLPTPEACPNSCPLSQWCHPTISSSVVPFFCLQSFPPSGSFLASQFFTSGSQTIGVWASASVLPMNSQSWFPLGWLVWSPYSPWDSEESSPIPQFKSISSSALSFFYDPNLTSIYDYWKNHNFDDMDLCWLSNIFAF